MKKRKLKTGGSIKKHVLGTFLQKRHLECIKNGLRHKKYCSPYGKLITMTNYLKMELL